MREGYMCEGEGCARVSVSRAHAFLSLFQALLLLLECVHTITLAD